MKQRKTPPFLIDEMCDIIQFEFTEFDPYFTSMLEPSAGEGDMFDELYLNRLCFDVRRENILCVELNEQKAKICADKNYPTLRADFLKHDFGTRKFDIIIAAPPFINNVDVEHIQKMYRLLKPSGIIVTLTTPYWTTNNEPHQVVFREFLKDKRYSLKMVPDNTFIEKGKTVPTAILTLHKKYTNENA